MTISYLPRLLSLLLIPVRGPTCSHLDSAVSLLPLCVFPCGSSTSFRFSQAQSGANNASLIMPLSCYEQNEVQTPRPDSEDLLGTGPQLIYASLPYSKLTPHKTVPVQSSTSTPPHVLAPFPPASPHPSPRSHIPPSLRKAQLQSPLLHISRMQ